VDDHQFQAEASAALDDLNRRLAAAAEDHDFEADFNAGALTIEFEDPPAKFVVSPNSPVKQIWVSAHSKSFKFDWDPARRAFVLNGQALSEMIAGAISQQLGETITL
jgi:CyaY protein